MSVLSLCCRTRDRINIFFYFKYQDMKDDADDMSCYQYVVYISMSCNIVYNIYSIA